MRFYDLSHVRVALDALRQLIVDFAISDGVCNKTCRYGDAGYKLTIKRRDELTWIACHTGNTDVLMAVTDFALNIGVPVRQIKAQSHAVSFVFPITL